MTHIEYMLTRLTPSKDRVNIKRFTTYNEALKWLHDNVSYSWDHAMRYEGWEIKEVEVSK